MLVPGFGLVSVSISRHVQQHVVYVFKQIFNRIERDSTGTHLDKQQTKLLYYLSKENALLLLEINQGNVFLFRREVKREGGREVGRQGGREGGREGGRHGERLKEEGREGGRKGETEGGRKAERDRQRKKDRAYLNLQASSQVAHDRSPSPP